MRVRARGRVQGVGFRASTQRRAQALALTGWVRNTPDGDVEALVQGEPAAVDALLEWMRGGGPPAGRVDELDVSDAPSEGSPTRFEIRA